MKRLYVLPLSVFQSHHKKDDGSDGNKYTDMFHAQSGAHYLHLNSDMILAAISFSSTTCEDIWHEHPDVAPLPHPTFEGNMPLQHVVDNPSRNLQQKHLDALQSIGVQPHHSVIDVHKISSKIHPLVKIRPLV